MHSGVYRRTRVATHDAKRRNGARVHGSGGSNGTQRVDPAPILASAQLHNMHRQGQQTAASQERGTINIAQNTRARVSSMASCEAQSISGGHGNGC
jgi:hypothetical protein